MEFKRHPHPQQNHHHGHQHHHHRTYNFHSRSNPGVNSGHGGFQGAPVFVSQPHHHHHPGHSRGYKMDGHHHAGRQGLSLTLSFRNLLKMQSDMANERAGVFQKLNQFRDLMISRISTEANKLLKDVGIDKLISNLQQKLVEENQAEEIDKNGNEEEDANEGSRSDSVSSGIQDIKNRWRIQVQEVVNSICDEAKIYAVREDNLMGAVFGKERGVEKHFAEFFNEAERQITDHEKKVRAGNDQYTQMLSRVRRSEDEVALRDHKCTQLEEALRIVTERNERTMTELQQVNADRHFEKLQLYHCVERAKVHAKSLAMEELKKISNWKRCNCGRDYKDVLAEFESNFNAHMAEGLGEEAPKEGSVGTEMNCVHVPSSWCYPTLQPQINGSIRPVNSSADLETSVDTTVKGGFVHDLRDRYDELKLKAAVIPNFESLRTHIMELVCHFKDGGFRVLEEMKGNQFVSTLFYCDEKQLTPSKDEKIVFSTGTGETVELATYNSLFQAVNQIHQLETYAGDASRLGMAYILQPPKESAMRKLDSQPIRMTLIRTYSGSKGAPFVCTSGECVQEGNLYHKEVNGNGNYMADWKIHIRVDDPDQDGIREKLKNVLGSLKDLHIANFINHRKLGQMYD